MSIHYIIITTIILAVGCLAGITNYLNYYFTSSKIEGYDVISDPKKKKFEIIKYIFSGMGAAILVPLLLNMLSSDLIKETANYDMINYFVFAGFCYIAGYFSDRFINTIGEKILKELEDTKSKVYNAVESTNSNRAKIDFLISTEIAVDENQDQSKINFRPFNVESTSEDDDTMTQINKIIKSFTKNFKFRTVKGISKELNYNEIVTNSILNDLQGQGIVKKLTISDGNDLWALTNLGLMAGKDNNTEKDGHA